METSPFAPTDPGLLALMPLSQGVKRSVMRGGVAPPGAQPLLARWERSRELGADPEGARALEEAVVSSSERRAARERTELLWREGHAVLESLAGASSRRDFVTLLSDANGIITHALGGGAFRQDARRLRLVEGAAWDEALRGTNAIGTAIVEGRPVAVHGAAHYARTNEGLVCMAAPIRDPRGELVAVVDVTSWARPGQDLDPTLPLLVAHSLEELLRSRHYARAGGLALVERIMEHTLEPAVLVEAPGRIVRTNAAARALAQRGELPALPAWQELARAAGFAPSEAPRTRPPHFSVEPIVDAKGELLGLVAFLRAPRVRQPRPTPPAPALAVPPSFEAVVGTDPTLTAAREQCARLARSDLPVLLLAETGTGKELFARAIHDASPRSAGPYIAVNCGAIQPELLLSELFGHGPAAFTGASRAGREGIVAAADGGTLFLDEVADLKADAQVALLRVLEDGSYLRVGETRTRHADLRIVAATSRDLLARVASGAFRKDLYFRIGGGCVQLPALRERSDFNLLLETLWSRVRLPEGGLPPRLAPSTRERLARHDWPGNVRELESVLEYAALMAEGAPLVTVRHLPQHLLDAPPRAVPASTHDARALDDTLRTSLVDALRHNAGNVSATARDLGVARSTVYRMAKRHGVPVDGPWD